jgi:hypothetical protein
MPPYQELELKHKLLRRAAYGLCPANFELFLKAILTMRELRLEEGRGGGAWS